MNIVGALFGGLVTLIPIVLFCVVAYGQRAKSYVDRLVCLILFGPVVLAGGVLSFSGWHFHPQIWFWILIALFAAGSMILLYRVALSFRLNPSDSRLLLACIISISILCGIASWRPYTYLFGGWDPGEYVSSAMNIARSGMLEVEDSFFASLDSAERVSLMHEPAGNRRTLHAGFLIIDEERGQLVPDYFHLYPCWLSVFGFVGGLDLVYWGQWVITLLSLCVLFLAVYEIFSLRVAVIAALLLICGPVQVYFGRFTSSEMLTRLFLFGAFYWYSRSLKTPAWQFDVLAGVSMGFAFLGHSTSVLPLAGVLAYLIGYAVWSRSFLPLRTAIVTIVFVAFAFAKLILLSPVMIRFLVDFIVGHPTLIAPVILLIGVGGAGFVMLRFWYARAKRKCVVCDAVYRWTPGILVVGIMLYLYFVRPYFGHDPNSLNLMIVGSALTMPVLILFAFFFVGKRWVSWSRSQSLFIVASSVATSVLIANRMAHPLLMWSLRRYVPIVVPFIVVVASVGVAYLLESRLLYRRFIGAAILLLVVVMLLWRAWPTWKVREFKGVPHAIEEIANSLSDADFVLCDHWRFSTPLRYAMGLPVYQFSRESDSIDSGEASTVRKLLVDQAMAGKRVCYITEGNGFYHPDIQFEQISEFILNSEMLKQTTRALPRKILPVNEILRVYACVPRSEDELEVPWVSAVKIDVGYHSMDLVSGFHQWRKAGDTGYRWTDGDGRVYIPIPADRGCDVSVRLAAARPDSLEEWVVPVDFYMGGQHIYSVTAKRDWHEVCFSVQGMYRSGTIAELSIRSPVWDPAKYGISGYATNLGVRVDWVRVTAKVDNPDVLCAE